MYVLQISLGLVAACLLALFFSTSLPVVELPAPAVLPPGAQLTLLSMAVLGDTIKIRGGESLIHHEGVLVTGTLDGFLTGFDPDTLTVRWSVECPASATGVPCRVLGLRSVGRYIYGVDLNVRLFRFSEGVFEWLLDSSTRAIVDLKPGFFNDLVVHGDLVYISDSYSEDGTSLGLLQRFFSYQPDGRVFSYNVTSREVRVVADQLRVANGLELEYGDGALLVAEGSGFRISRIDLVTGQVGVWAAGTLGAVDNIRRSRDGGYWIGVSSGRSRSPSYHDVIAWSPAIRYLTRYKAAAPLLYLNGLFFGEGARFYKTDRTGNIERVFLDNDKISGTITFSEICEVGHFLFVGNPFSPNVFRMRL